MENATQAERAPSFRATEIVVGVLFLTSTATFVIGSRLITSYFDGSASTSALIAGVLLEVYTGLAVAGIGIAMLPVFERFDRRLGRTYLVLRVLECLAIVSVGVWMITTHDEFPKYSLLIYSFTATGGLVFAYLLDAYSLVARGLARLGLIGYASLLVGVVLSLFGVADLDEGWGTILFVPGAIFEFVLPIVLFVKGFSLEETANDR
jgi:hypothetical protein